MNLQIKAFAAPEIEPKRLQCRHIFTDGHRCGSPCLRYEVFCYYHHNTRRPAQRRRKSKNFTLPLPEDRSAVQHSIGQVLQRIAQEKIDPKRAALLLYGLQIASANLPRHRKPQETDPTVVEVTRDPTLGLLCEEAEYTDPNKPVYIKGPGALWMEEMEREEQAEREAREAHCREQEESRYRNLALEGAS